MIIHLPEYDRPDGQAKDGAIGRLALRFDYYSARSAAADHHPIMIPQELVAILRIRAGAPAC